MAYYKSSIPYSARDSKKIFEFSNSNTNQIEYN